MHLFAILSQYVSLSVVLVFIVSWNRYWEHCCWRKYSALGSFFSVFSAPQDLRLDFVHVCFQNQMMPLLRQVRKFECVLTEIADAHLTIWYTKAGCYFSYSIWLTHALCKFTNVQKLVNVTASLLFYCWNLLGTREVYTRGGGLAWMRFARRSAALTDV